LPLFASKAALVISFSSLLSFDAKKARFIGLNGFSIPLLFWEILNFETT